VVKETCMCGCLNCMLPLLPGRMYQVSYQCPNNCRRVHEDLMYGGFARTTVAALRHSGFFAVFTLMPVMPVEVMRVFSAN
jgi:hypothetical protein